MKLRRIAKIVGLVGGGAALLIVVLAYTLLPLPSLRQFSGPPPLFSFNVVRGSGFFISRDGWIVTAAHVVHGCRRITVAGTQLTARRADITFFPDDRDIDLALVHLPDIASVPNLSLGSFPWAVQQGRAVDNAALLGALHAMQLATGGNVTVLGYPGSYAGRAPQTAPGRLAEMATSLDRRHWYPRLDAPVGPGNSGGPVIDRDGDVVGVVIRSIVDLPAHGAPDRSDPVQQQALIVPAKMVKDFIASRLSAMTQDRSPAGADDAVVRLFCFKTFF